MIKYTYIFKHTHHFWIPMMGWTSIKHIPCFDRGTARVAFQLGSGRCGETELGLPLLEDQRQERTLTTYWDIHGMI